LTTAGILHTYSVTGLKEMLLKTENSAGELKKIGFDLDRDVPGFGSCWSVRFSPLR